MPKLRVLFTLLEQHGFHRVRQRGSHVIMRREAVSFPVPLHRQLDRGTLAGIRQSGLPRDLFLT